MLTSPKNIVLSETLKKPSEGQLVAIIKYLGQDKLSCQVPAIPINKISVCYMARISDKNIPLMDI